MLDQILNMVRQQGQDAVVNNTAIPNEHNEAVMQEASGSILSGLQGMLQQGGVGNVLEAFTSGKGVDASQVSGMQSGFAESIGAKFGIDGAQATKVAATLIPSVLSQLGSKLQSGNLDLNQILSGVAGSGQGGLMENLSAIGKKAGLDKDGDGDVDLNDVMKMF